MTASLLLHLMFEGQAPEELVDLEHAGFDGRAGRVLPQPDDLPFGDGGSEAHALDDPSAGLRIDGGPGGHGDVGGVFLMLLITHCRRWSREGRQDDGKLTLFIEQQ